MSDLKAIAIYLPQYHRVKENDEWWGENYTEWTAVREADKLYEGHEQPRVPLNENYYDLSQKETMEWQANLAKEYGVYGFCFYHYYFKDGRKILEKPAENLLKWSDIDINYCFSWANESWVRTWGKITGGSMASKFEKYGEGESVLLQQWYGNEKEWKEHFEYLLPFFRDKRYIKIHGKPVFLFHVPEIIDCLEKMVSCWRKLAEDNGLPGLYLIGVITNSYQEFPALDAVYAHEPRFLFHDFIRYSDETKSSICNRYNLYEEACRWSSRRIYNQKQKIYFGTFAGFDSTPRHGTRGIIIDKVTPEAFEKNFRDMSQRSIACNNEFIFINAWNEWGESNYLEPDNKNGFAFLNAIKKVKSEEWDKKNFIVSDSSEDGVLFKVIKDREVERDKFKSYYKVLDQWLVLLEGEKELTKYFEKHNYNNLAIYGFGRLGRHLFNQLNTRINVKYVIDKKVSIDNFCLPIYNFEDDFPEADVIVVTVINEFEQICEDLSKKFAGDIVSLNEVIKGCL